MQYQTELKGPIATGIVKYLTQRGIEMNEFMQMIALTCTISPDLMDSMLLCNIDEYNRLKARVLN